MTHLPWAFRLAHTNREWSMSGVSATMQVCRLEEHDRMISYGNLSGRQYRRRQHELESASVYLVVDTMRPLQSLFLEYGTICAMCQAQSIANLRSETRSTLPRIPI